MTSQAALSWSTSLDNWQDGSFVPIYDSGTKYGGNQSWASRSTVNLYGCGAVAAANIAHYLDTVNPSTYGNLYQVGVPSTSKTMFLYNLDQLYDYMNINIPESWGTTGSEFITGMTDFADSRGVVLTSYEYKIPFTRTATSYADSIMHIRLGLTANTPVAMLNANSSDEGYDDGTTSNPTTPEENAAKFEVHWVTATRYEKLVDGKDIVIVSSWNKLYEVDYQIWYDIAEEGFVTGFIEKSKLIYFK